MFFTLSCGGDYTHLRKDKNVDKEREREKRKRERGGEYEKEGVTSKVENCEIGEGDDVAQDEKLVKCIIKKGWGRDCKRGLEGSDGSVATQNDKD